MIQPFRPVTVVNITSISFSGSTWLNLLLGSHSQAFSIGEMKHILAAGRAMCSLHGEACEFWPRFDLRNMQDHNPFLDIARLSDRRLLIVNNSRKFLRYQDGRRVVRRFIHLVRDGRAVAASYLRKFPRMTMWQVAGMLAHEFRRNRRLIRRQPAGSTLLVRYEYLCGDREGELRRIASWLDLDFDQAMSEFWKPAHHFIGGNHGTLGWVGRNDDSPSERAVTHRVLEIRKQFADGWKVDFYRDKNPETFRDERWKTELTPRQLRIFALRVGLLNRSFGYGMGAEPLEPRAVTA